jgi:hypothetical protein
MREQSDDLVQLIHDAAGQVGPVAGIDGETMAGRAIRRERVRRGVIGGAVAFAVMALVAVGGLAASGRQVLPASWFAGDVPAGWTKVSGGGLILAVPPDFEAFAVMGAVPAWGVDPVTDGEWGTMADTMVAVVPAAEDSDPIGSYGEPVETTVPGATSAWYAWDASGGPDELEGVLVVGLESGAELRVVVVLNEMPEAERVFKQLVDTVRVDPDADESDMSLPDEFREEQLTLDVVRELPSDWAVQEHQGLRFAVPGDWVEDDHSAARSAQWPSMSMNDGTGQFRLQMTASLTAFDDEDSYGAVFDLPPGADRAGASLSPANGALTTQIKVRREGGRSYTIDVNLPEGEDSERFVRTIAGSLGFTAEADDVPTYEDLPDARLRIDDAPEVPDDWVSAEGPGFRLRVPPAWVVLDEGFGNEEIVFDPRRSDGEEESLAVWTEEPGILSSGEVHLGGYRLDVPGAVSAVVRMTDYTSYGEPELFAAFVEVRRSDGSHVKLSYDGPNPDEERFWQILGTLEVDAP